MKVAHLVTYGDGGAGTAALRIHESLLQAGVNSRVLTTFIPPSLASERINVIAPNQWVLQLERSWVKRQKDRMRFRLKKHLGLDLKPERETVTDLFDKIEDKLDCEIATLPFSTHDLLQHPFVKEADIIHLHWVSGMIDYPIFFKNNTKPVVWTLHDMNPFMGLFHFQEDEDRNAKIAGVLNNKVTKLKVTAARRRKSKLVYVAPSNWLFLLAQHRGSFHKVKGLVIPYPIDGGIFNIQDSGNLKSALQIESDRIILLFVAHSISIHRKGFDLLQKALQKLRYLPITLLVLGNAKGLIIDDVDVRLLGTILDNKSLAAYYSVADAFLLPSREDNLPNVMIESLSCGTPVIGFSVGGLKEHIVDYKTGLLAPEISARSLAQTIENFIENKSRFSKDHIRKYAHDNFNQTKVASQYISVYESILKS